MVLVGHDLFRAFAEVDPPFVADLIGDDELEADLLAGGDEDLEQDKGHENAEVLLAILWERHATGGVGA